MAKYLAAVALVAVFFGGGMPMARGQAAAPAAVKAPAPTRLAVVNMVELFDRLDAKKAADDQIDALVTDLDNQTKTRQEEVKQLQDELHQYKEGSDIYNQTQNKLMTKAMELQAFGQYFVPQKRMMEMRLKTAALYTQINKAIADYAKANGIALVLVADAADLSEAKTREELVSKITVRKVIYADSSLDITQQIVEKMNADYKLGGGK